MIWSKDREHPLPALHRAVSPAFKLFAMTPPIDLPLVRQEGLLLDDNEGEVRRSVTGRGTRILTQRAPSTRSAALSLWVPVGSRDEAPEAAGSTHFLEHLLFKGTPKRSAFDIAESFDRVGGESNAETGREHTNYWARVLSEDLEMALGVLVDMLSNATIGPEEFAMERGVILDELAMAEDSPTEIVHDAFQLAVHGDVPLGRPVGGTPETIRAAQRDEVVAHYRSHYAPDNLVVAAAGDVDHGRLVDLVEAAIEASPWADAPSNGRAPRARRSCDAWEEVEHEPSLVRRRDVEQAHLVVGTRGLRALADEGPTMSVLLSVLGGSMSSRLFQEVREKRGLAYTTYAFESSYSDTGAFGMYAGTSPDKIDQVERLMLEQLHDLAENGPTEAELLRVRGQVRGGVALGLEDNWSRMMRLGRSELVGRYKSVDESLEAIEAVTADEVAALARELASRSLSRALVLPLDS